MVYVLELLADLAAKYVSEDQEASDRQYHAAAREGSVDTGLPVQHPAHVETSTASNATHVVQLWRRIRLRHFPLARELSDVRLGFLVNVESTEIAAAGGLVQGYVRCGSMLPILGEGPKVFDPLLAPFLVGRLITTSVLVSQNVL